MTSFLDKFKKNKGGKFTKKEVVAEKPVESVEIKKEKEEIKEKPLTLRKENRPVKPYKEDTGNAYKVLFKPLITEKVSALGGLNKYVFAVSLKANKNEIVKAIRSLYGVEVVKVNIINTTGKKIRYGRSSGKRKDWKKAIVTIKEGQSIQVYEGV